MICYLFSILSQQKKKNISIKNFLFRIPTDIFITEKPLLARWIPEKNHWRQDGYVDYQYAPGKKEIDNVLNQLFFLENKRKQNFIFLI